MNQKGRTIVLLVISVLVTLGAVRFIMTFKKEAEDVEEISSKKLVQIQEVKNASHHAEIKLTGALTASHQLELFSEVSGVLMNDNFKAGNSFQKGEVLLKLNDSEFSNSLKAQKSVFISQVAAIMADIKVDFSNEYAQWEEFLNGLKVEAKLPALPEVKELKLKRYLSGKSILNTYYSILAQEEKLDKYTITAPFNGVVTSSMVNQGSLIRVGQKLGEFIDPSSLEYETEVSLSDLKFLSLGNEVLLSSNDLNKSWKGKVIRINQKVEDGTQRIKVFILTSGEGLKEGMFLSGKLQSEEFGNAFLVNRMDLQDGKVFLYQKGKAVERKVQVLHINENQAIVEGLNDGDSVIVGNLNGVYHNAEVTVE